MEHTPGLSAERSIDHLFELFAELVSRTRFEILCALAQQPQDVTSLTRKLELTMSLISGHLARLAQEELVAHRVIGKAHLYQLGPAVSWEPTPHGRQLGIRIGPDIEWLLRLRGAVLARLVGIEARGTGDNGRDSLSGVP